MQGLEYIPSVHDHLVIELVTSASPPHIAVSSLATISYRRFDLIIRKCNSTAAHHHGADQARGYNPLVGV